MKSANKFLAIWMDHEKAHLIEPGVLPAIQTMYRSEKENAHEIGENADGIKLGNFRSSNNEFHKHRKAENQFNVFCKQLTAGLNHFDVLLICGPGEAHKEFRNYLLGEKQFKDKKVVVETTDYLTENQIKAFVNTKYHETLENVNT